MDTAIEREDEWCDDVPLDLEPIPATQRSAGTGPSLASAEHPTWPPDSGRKRILVVDDDEPTARLVARVLREEHDVLVARDGVEGLEVATSQPPPDLVITDVSMPRMDGLTMAARIKHEGPTHRVPVIFVTACSDAADVIAGIQAGARNYLTKPVSLEQLEAKVRGALAA